MMEIIIGVTGATGVIYAVKLLEGLSGNPDVNTHLIMSDWAKENLKAETDYALNDMENLASEIYDNNNLGAKISSGSFITDGMVVLPCSMKTLSSIAFGYCESLISRAADVTIKEGRRLVLCPRETPLNSIHLENMLRLSNLGVRIMPPMPAFYTRPRSLEDMIGHHIMKIFDQFGIKYHAEKRWDGSKGQG